MTRRVNQVLWEQWRERLERQRGSGLSIAEFCRQEGVSSITFHTWKRKIQGAGGAHSAMAEVRSERPTAKLPDGTSRRRGPRRVRRDVGTTFARPRDAEFLQLPVLGVRSAPWIELTLVDGTRVRIPQQNLVALQSVFTILRGGAIAALPDEVSHA